MKKQLLRNCLEVSDETSDARKACADNRKIHKKIIKAAAVFLSLCMMFHSLTDYVEAKSMGKKPIVISFDHRRNIGSIKGMSADAVSSATVYSGATGETKSTIEVIRSTIQSGTGAANFNIKVKKTYSKNYRKTVNRARKEIDNDMQVKLVKKKVSGLKKYDTNPARVVKKTGKK